MASTGSTENGAPHEPQVEVVQKKPPTRVGAALHGCSMLIILILVVIGTGVPWIYNNNSQDPKARIITTISLWEIKSYNVDNATLLDSVVKVSDIKCDVLVERFKAAQSFALISIGVAVFGLIIGLINWRKDNGLKWLAVLISLALCVTTLITWGIVADIYRTPRCGAPKSLYDQDYDLYAGAGLFIASWIITFVSMVVCVVDPFAPVDERLNSFGVIAFTVLVGVSFLFSLVGTATTWFKLTNYATGVKKEVNLWGTTVTTNGTAVVTPFKDMVGCDDYIEIWRAASAFAIASIAFGAFSFAVALYNAVVTGLEPVKKANGTYTRKREPAMRMAMLFGYTASLCMLITWALGAKIYYSTWCQSTLNLSSEMYRFREGAALFVAGWVCTFFANFIVTLCWMFGRASSPLANVSKAGFFFAIAMAASLALMIIGTSLDFASNTSPTLNIYVSLWRTTITTATSTIVIDVADLEALCKERFQRLRAGEGFSILSCIFLLVALLAGAFRLKFEKARLPSCFAAIAASIFMVITWAVEANIYNSGFCGQPSLREAGYSISAGMGLIVAAWCLTLVFLIPQLIW